MDNIERQRQIVDALRSQFIYDPEAGFFFNRKTGRPLIGSMTHRHHGHLTVTISLRSKNAYVSRIAKQSGYIVTGALMILSITSTIKILTPRITAYGTWLNYQKSSTAPYTQK